LVSFYVFLGFLVDLALNSGGGFDIVKVLQKLVQLCQPLAQIFDRHRSILIEVEADPVFVNKHSYVAVGFGDVLCKRGLPFAQNSNEHSNEVGCFVHVDYDFLINVADRLAYLSGQLLTALSDLLVLRDVVHVGIRQFVRFGFFKILKTARSLKEPQI